MSTSSTQTKLVAPDISCGHCVATVTKAVAELEGVGQVEASEHTKEVTVNFDPARVSEEQIRNAMTSSGYPPAP